MKKTTMALIAMLICFGQANYATAQSFSVSPTKKVIFSPGNLQWSAEGTHTTATGSAPGSWKFATGPTHISGSNNEIISSTYYTWWTIDLFGWATSGYTNEGRGSESYNTSIEPLDYTLQSSIIDISGTNYDWGTFNAIYNPKTGKTDAPGTWRTLTKEEWEYLFTSRTDAKYKCGDASINYSRGIVILPDYWILPSGLTFNYGFPDDADEIAKYHAKNDYTEEQWKQMEAAGAVFLPTAGIRTPNKFFPPNKYVSDVGVYWSSTIYNPNDDESGRENSTRAYCIFFDKKNLKPNVINDINYGFSVRLVRDVKKK